MVNHFEKKMLLIEFVHKNKVVLDDENDVISLLKRHCVDGQEYKELLSDLTNNIEEYRDIFQQLNITRKCVADNGIFYGLNAKIDNSVLLKEKKHSVLENGLILGSVGKSNNSDDLNSCLKEKCFYYDDMVEYAIDGCTYGCSEKDFEEERPCDR